MSSAGLVVHPAHRLLIPRTLQPVLALLVAMPWLLPRTLRSSVHLQRLLDQDGGGLPGSEPSRVSLLRASITSPVAPPPAPTASLTQGLPQRPTTQQPQQQQQRLPEQPSSSNSSVVQSQAGSFAAQRAVGSLPGSSGPLSSSAGALPRGLVRSSAAPKPGALQVVVM
jgi:hypothetical protein